MFQAIIREKIMYALSIKIFYLVNVYLLNVCLCDIYYKKLGNKEQIDTALFLREFLTVQYVGTGESKSLVIRFIGSSTS